MIDIILIGIALCVLVLVLTAGGVALVWKQILKSRNLNRYSLLAATLTTAIGYWLMKRSPLALNMVEIDLVVTLALVCVVTYIVFLICIERVLTSHLHSPDFQKSSVLSMLYMESRQDDHEFQPTTLMVPKSSDSQKNAP
jgi:hypothetical protein